MKERFGFFPAACVMAGLMFGAAAGARAQITTAAGYTPPDDTPTVNVGGTIFADYTYVQEPTVTGSDGSQVHPNAFNLSRAYINVTGQINHLIQFRITPDVVRVGQVAGANVPGLSGTLGYRLKYAYGQLSFSDFTTKGSWFRLGLQQTPWIDFEEGIYRYRFAGTILSDREGALASSDLGASAHWNIPGDYGDFHAGVYNGNGYTAIQDTDSQMSYQIRGTIRPLPRVPFLKGLRFSGFYDGDHYATNAKKERIIGMVSYESPYLNAGLQYDNYKDQTTAASSLVEGKAYSVWATPRTCFGLEALLRWDRVTPDNTKSANKQRIIAGPAYWFPVTKAGVAAAVMIKWEQVRYMGAPNSKPTEESLGLFTLFNF